MYTVKSSQRSSGTPQDCKIDFYSNLEGVYQVKTLVIPNTFFNVDSTNNTIYFFENGLDKSCTLTSGVYDTSTLETEFLSKMNTASTGFNTFTASYNSSTFKYTITGTSVFILRFGTFTTTSAATVLGFTSANTASSTSQTSDSVVDLSSLASVGMNIMESNIPGVENSVGQRHSLYVPLSASGGSYIYTFSTDLSQYLRFAQPTKTLSVKIVNPVNNNVISLNGFNWELLLSPMC